MDKVIMGLLLMLAIALDSISRTLSVMLDGAILGAAYAYYWYYTNKQKKTK